jgi:tRNA dimethylallyltransferase
LIRALSVIRQTGKPFSFYLDNQIIKRNFVSINLLLDIQRDTLYERINQRVENMMERGLEAEARQLYDFKKLKSLQTVGYKELFDYFDGLITLGEAIELIKRNSRRYAKRQLTWFNNKGNWERINPLELDRIVNIIKSKMQ